MVALRYAARSDIGLGRYRNNQDSGYAGTNLLVVADGMGGHAGGDIASSLAISNLISLDDDAPGADALQELEGSIHHAADIIRERVLEEPELAGMGTTVTAILKHGNRLALAHIGDSRAYLLHEGELTQVTSDHTFVQRLVDEGKITSDEADRHPQRNIVLRVIGDVDAPEDVDTSVREAVIGDRWLLCSDGLSGFVSMKTLEEAMNAFADPGECANQLIQLALKAGGADNITCIVADVVPFSSSPATVPQVVGAAGSDRAKPTVAPPDSPAARAAALTRGPAPEPDADEVVYDDEPEPRGPTLVRRFIGAAVAVVIIAAGIYGAWVWTQRQFYVGASDEGHVTIYRGLPDPLGPINLSSAYEDTKLPVDTLNSTNQRRVNDGIGADDVTDAHRIVTNLWGNSSLCTGTTTVVPGQATPSATPGAAATTTDTTTTQPETATSATPTADGGATPTSAPTPAECP